MITSTMPDLLIPLRNMRNQLNQHPFLVYLTFLGVLGVGFMSNLSNPASAQNLDSFLEDTTVTGTIDSSNAISEILFDVPTAGSLDLTFSLMLEEAGLASKNTFGLYDTANNKFFEIFAGEATPGSTLSASITSESQLLIGGMSYDLAGPVTFYLSRNLRQSSETFLSNDIYSGMPQALMYQGEGEEIRLNDLNTPLTNNDYLIGFEDRKGRRSDKDYNDMVVLAQTVLRLPEPSEPAIPSNDVTIPEPSLLSGLGMMAILGMAKRRTA
ncbi:hypothetical protein [Cyanothece sp. BG0011]|uniref:hypothetical protein n=2 Tax=Cyanothece sp. BG0011 TaxID=2082950 RepID=UPI0030D8E843